MPRASQYLLEGYTYHLTHRCHNRQFLLRLARDRDVYREWLREGVRRHRIPVYGYCITSNHVHLVVHTDSAEAVSDFMHLAAGATAKQFNLRNDHLGSMWEHPYQCTVVQDGRHLFNCLCYVDLNMVRAGNVTHPGQWRWSGYDELSGKRQRYRLLDLDRLLQSLGVSDLRAFREQYIDAINRRLSAGSLVREAYWTESLAVGSKGFVDTIPQCYPERRGFNVSTIADGSASAWTIREATSAYGAISSPENDL